MVIQSDILSKMNTICNNITTENQTCDEKVHVDTPEFPRDTYVLIVPSNNKGNGGENYMKCGKIMTMTSDEFLLAFRSLLGVPEENTECDTEETELEAYITRVIPEKLESKTRGQFTKPLVKKSMVEVATQTCDILVQTSIDEYQSKPISYDLAGSDDKPDGISATDSTVSVNKTNSNCARDVPVAEYLLKDVLRDIPSHIRNLSLNEYCPPWIVGGHFKDMSFVKRLYCHLALLNEFCCTAQSSTEAQILIRRYLQYLVQLCAEISLASPHGDKHVLEFGDLVLLHTRKTGTWDFKSAWSQAETDERKRLKRYETTSRSISPSMGITKKVISHACVRSKHSSPILDRTINDNERLQRYKTSTKYTNGSELSPPISDHNHRLRFSNSEGNNETRRHKPFTERHVEFVHHRIGETRTGKRHSVRELLSIQTKRPKLSSQEESPSGGKRPLLKDPIDGAVELISKKNNHGFGKKPMCKFFNSIGGCFKPLKQCNFSHRCSLCYSFSHGQPDCTKK